MDVSAVVSCLTLITAAKGIEEILLDFNGTGGETGTAGGPLFCGGELFLAGALKALSLSLIASAATLFGVEFLSFLPP